ncbi:hypothetical protein WMY93_010969 [Mugilogobius chulae]|uniref:Protein-tyrosine-phosphatase n=1 Tax=Mugilogobius chulae TaxID=88201 RepID=A0AAW0P965_9GOBI
MDFFTFRFTSYGLLLVFCTCLFWRATDSSTMNMTQSTSVTPSPSMTTSSSMTTSPSMTTQMTAQPTTAISLIYTQNDLIPAQKYRMILYSRKGSLKQGLRLKQAQKTTTENITLQWNKEDSKISYILMVNDEKEENITLQELESLVQCTVTNLQNTTIYNFTLITVFENITGTGVSIRAATVPRDATGFKAKGQTETSITLQWDKVDDIQDYVLNYEAENVTVPATSEAVVLYNVTNLKSGTRYTFTLYTDFYGLKSNGTSHPAPTVPPQVSSVEVTERNLTTITLQWTSVSKDWEYNVEFDGSVQSPTAQTGDLVIHTVKTLKPGTVYLFSIRTKFSTLLSKPFEKETATVIDCTAIHWSVTETSIRGEVDGAFTSAIAYYGSQPHHNSGFNNSIQFTGLYPGANYTINLMYKDLEQGNCDITMKLGCGYSIYIEWDSPYGVWDSVEIKVSNQEHEVLSRYNYAIIHNFQPAKKYQVSISSKSGSQRSSLFVFTCATDARGVIAGAFFGVLLFVILIGVVVFVMLRRPDIISQQKKSLSRGSKTSVKKAKRIPLERFPGLFNELSADENKGFSLEYEGYNSSREFIATQGPLPSTVSDFWRMIWEQKVRGIVMVTNCTEGGRIKCEQYWPDRNSCICGDLEVFTTSEQKEPDWTLREFKLKHRRTSEERTVRHFHFTAWPDHGVPQGTQVLIQFRALLRRHLETEAAGTPTVVHCSAGVGRTGTIIALDVLLQQMQKEKAVDINGFVYKMRLNRPHMVQTESQYVFLHQCILDSLLLNKKPEENIYENELIYANATALREFDMNNA